MSIDVTGEIRPPTSNPKPTVHIGDRVGVMKGDGFVHFGLTGLVVNALSGMQFGKPQRCRVLWDNDTVSFIDRLHVVVLRDGMTTHGRLVALRDKLDEATR